MDGHRTLHSPMQTSKIGSMVPVEAVGYTNVVALQEASAAVPQAPTPETTDGKTREQVLHLCRQLAELLKPFALVESTNERWRCVVLAVAEKVHDAAVALHIDDPALGTLSEGTDGLECYGGMVGSLKFLDQVSIEEMMDAPQMMDAMAQAIERCAASADVHPLDEWQLNKDAVAVHDFTYSVMCKLTDDGECTRADQLLTQAAEVIGGAAAREGLSALVKERLTRFVKNTGRRKEQLAKARAKAREQDQLMQQSVRYVD